MKCPYDIPLKPVFCKLADSWIIEDSNGKVVFADFNISETRADYIVHVINSHEKLQDTIFEVARQAIAKYDVNAPPLTKNRFANEFVDSLEQALKESEKE